MTVISVEENHSGIVLNKEKKLLSFQTSKNKILKNFSISFKDLLNKPLDITIIAGINGTGKTTILKSIHYHVKNSILLSAGQNIDDIKIILPKYIETMVYEKGIAPFESYKQLRGFINTIFEGLDLQIEFDSRDGAGKLFFKNKNKSEEKFSIDELSTGEKTLLSKILYLYINDVKSKVILIDEPELSLHPTWQNKVLDIYERFAKKNNCQIIIATHSPHIIGSAKSEYLRILKFNKDNNVEVINIDKSFGLEVNDVLTEIMGVKDTRTPEISKKIGKMWHLLEEEEHESKEYLELYSELEDILGDLDQDLLLARLEVAKLKAQNA